MEETREVVRQEAEDRADMLGFEYFEVSAKTGDNIELLFQSIARYCPTNDTIFSPKLLSSSRSEGEKSDISNFSVNSSMGTNPNVKLTTGGEEKKRKCCGGAT